MSMRKRIRWSSSVSGSVLVAGVVTMVVAAALVNGIPVRHVDLNDGGIWVTSDFDGLFGRINRPAGSLDAAFNPPNGVQSSYSLDVVQDGSAVVAWDKASGNVFAVDIARGATVGTVGLGLPGVAVVGMGGGSLAILDVQSGEVRAVRVDPGDSLAGLTGLEADTPPSASVAPDATPDSAASAAMVVGTDGTVFAVSSAGRVATLSPNGSGGFAAPIYRDLGHAVARPMLTAIGGQLVVLDASTGELTLPNGRTTKVTGDSLALQQAGPAVDSVLVATESALFSVDLDSGEATTLSQPGQVGRGDPAAPVRLGGCVHSAWSGSGGGYFFACGGAELTKGNLSRAQALVSPVFRVNRSAIVLNDLKTGAVWDLATQQRVDDWSSLRPPPQPSESGKTRPDPVKQRQQQPPHAVDDLLGARPGRTTLLHVLDNDSDPAGSILSVAKVTAPSSPAARLSISPDGQTVAISLDPSATGTVQFTYTVNDGRQSSDASVTVDVRMPGENEAPKLRPSYEAPAYAVASGRRLALPVLADWRDFDGDPIALTGASATAGSVTARPDGFLDFTAPVEGGTQTLTYHVSDGLSDPSEGTVDVTVKAPTDTTAVAAITQPDVARGQVGMPITLRPLDNDIPGSDPTKPEAVLALAGDFASPDNATVVTNLTSGVVVVTASRPGTYVMEYKVAFGNAPFANGQIRVDVVPVPDSPAPPVAMPDKVVLRGQEATMVDVLANDFDPAGGLLTVQRAQAADGVVDLQVAIVDGRWVRINAVTAFSGNNSELVHYTISNGVTGPVTGEITVSRLPEEPDNKPVAVDDKATVRAGDTVTVAVLDNDSNPAGVAMTLAPNVADAPGPGQLAVTAPGVDDPGKAYVTGNLVRYVAPAKVAAATTVSVAYVVQNAAGDSAVGRLKVLVNPAPGADLANRPPSPAPLEVRATAGQTITITVPTSGVDVDGDSVTLVGLASAPALGRVESWNATSLTYVAFPTSAGTDSFDYRVQDRYGATGRATIRVGVTPPGRPQPPVAVDDVITAAPGAKVHADVLANDLWVEGDVVSIGPLAESNADLPAGVSLVEGTGLIDVIAPDATGKPTVVVYSLSDGLGTPSLATLTVRSREGFNNPPVAYDVYPPVKLGETTVTVDLLKESAVFDPDGDTGELRLVGVSEPTATFSGMVITLPVPADSQPYTVSYEVRDKGGATAVGLIHVPVPGSGAPYANGQRIIVGKDATTNVDINDYVIDPAGKPVRLTTTDKIWASPPAGLTATDQGATGLVLTGVNGYTGPGALTFEVTDGVSLTDPAGRTAIVTIPVQVGPETPVLHCPDDPITVVEGGGQQRIDIASVCHVWVADSATLGKLNFTAAWDGPATGFSFDGSGTPVIAVEAAAGTAPGTTANLTIGVAGNDDVTPSTLHVRVVAAPPLSIKPIVLDGVIAGTTASVDVSQYVASSMRGKVVKVLGITQSAGQAATATADGSTVTITPDPASHGDMTFAITVTDVVDATRLDRHVTGQITVHTLGVPDAPGQPQLGAEVLSGAVELSWSTPANNGAPIELYEVAYAGRTRICAASPCLITGLTNGNTYTFTVRAKNLVGWSPPSPASAPAVPNTVPGAVTSLVVSNPQDHTLHLEWNAPHNEGTPVTQYRILWSGGGSGTSATESFDATGLDNDTVYTFTVIAVNALGPGPEAEVQGQSAGAPSRPNAPTFSSVNLAGSTTRAVSVSWAPVGPNGPGPTTYTLTRTGGSGTVTVCANVTATSCNDDGIANDGTIYTYTVVAANAVASADPANHTSPASPGAQMEASATPEPITGYTISATGTSGQAVLHFNVGASHGASSTVTCTYSGINCGTWTFPVAGQTNVTRTINGLPNGSARTVYLQTCNGSGGGLGAGSPCNSAVGATVTTYGPITGFSVTPSTSGTTAYFTISVNPNGYPVTVTVDGAYLATTGTGAWSQRIGYNIGYSSTRSVVVQVVDTGGGRPSQTLGASATTGPPPPTVTLFHYDTCSGASCGSGSCSGTCSHIGITVSGSGGGTVTCFDFNSSQGVSSIWGTKTRTGDGDIRTGYFVATGGTNWVSVTCTTTNGTASSGQVPW